jgi:Na+/proline symporter
VIPRLPALLAAANGNLVEIPHGITAYDYGIIGFYVVFMLSLGVLFRGLSRNTSDYFRCGGAMPWWITGTSAWVATFTAWSFVGAASEIYKSGLKVMLLFYASLPALLLVFGYTCIRFRRLRVVTWMEAVRERFGGTSEQFYTWIKVPVELIKAGIYLMTISVFIAAVLKVEINGVIIVLGLTITIVAFAGGAFAVLASDFVQMFLVMTITIVAMVLAVGRPEIGGFSGLLDKVNASHPEHFRWWLAWRPSILFGWGLAFTWVKFAELNSLEYSTMYLMPKSEKHARRMVVIPMLGGIVGPLIWMVPPLVATVLFPNLGAIFPTLLKPTEGAFVATALAVMPVGLLGLLMCAMFGATLTSMDAAVNKYVGVFVRSFYRPILKPNAPETHLLRVSKACTLAFGAIIIGISLVVNTYRQTDVFTLLNQFMVSLGLPLTIPIFLGLFIRKTPSWSAWVTALAAFCFSAWANFPFAEWIQSPHFLSEIPGFAQAIIGSPDRPLTPGERADLLLVVTALGTSLVGVTVFLATRLFHGRSPEEHRARVDALFAKLKVPVEPAHDADISDEPVYRLLGALCMVYGAFILLLMLIPNPFIGRLCFLFVGGIIGIVGAVLYAVANRKRARKAAAAVHDAPIAT